MSASKLCNYIVMSGDLFFIHSFIHYYYYFSDTLFRNTPPPKKKKILVFYRIRIRAQWTFTFSAHSFSKREAQLWCSPVTILHKFYSEDSGFDRIERSDDENYKKKTTQSRALSCLVRNVYADTGVIKMNRLARKYMKLFRHKGGRR